MAEKAVELIPNDMCAVRMRSLVSQATGNLEQALHDTRRVVELYGTPGWDRNPEGKKLAESYVTDLEANLRENEVMRAACYPPEVEEVEEVEEEEVEEEEEEEEEVGEVANVEEAQVEEAQVEETDLDTELGEALGWSS